ncbi:UDP-N-acetylglucosamine 4,6-dehydratase (inverting) [Parachlamydia acanthamoebae]|uniref:UDP-glucose 4-epimerase n=2 Tax=Parachlamydia acanthamoebae TaxID=83552 RepID=F8L177_PARAV|nr:UDP-N-acetylglucosamine 4,6-dehydratase (inverting) [Parachlamydia acanthamoebae]CCB86998.1 UDP-glucose 4-epimerase [Parachlamydia acanthamoebae UV-7]
MSQSSLFANKNVLITGGTGSFGRTFAKNLIEENLCNKVIIFSRDEWKQWEMKQSSPLFAHPKMRYFLGDIRDKERLRRAFNEVHFVIHAAALKQVPAAEYNPSEFINTNVLGAMNVIDAAIDCNVEKVIALSTDKAVNPVNLYGATKLCSDKLFVAGNSYVGAKGAPRFSVVRYGNVLGSRGSLIPFWRKLIEEGCTSLPLTDPRMTRFWITLDETVSFVRFCFTKMHGGEIFVPKIPSMKIIELAEAMAPGLALTHTGIREGEKLHELMISTEDARHTFEFENHYAIIPEIYRNYPALVAKYQQGSLNEALPDEFCYASNTNTQWLSKDKLQDLLKTIL